MKQHHKVWQSLFIQGPKIILALLMMAKFCAVHADGIPKDFSDKNILILNSYGLGYSWSDGIRKGIDRVLDSSKIKATRFYEFMDSKLTEDSEHVEHLAHLYEFKYRHTSFDLIIASDNNALEFLRLYRDLLFAHTPVVLCGINDYHDSLLAGFGMVTGVVQNTDYQANIDLARQLFPDKKYVVFITDDTQTGKAHARHIYRDLGSETRAQQLLVLSLGKMSMSELTDSLAKLSNSAVAIPLSHFIDKAGIPYTLKQSMEKIGSAFKGPMLVVSQSWMPFGSLGGKIVSGEEQGASAAKIGLKILNNNAVSNLPMVMYSPNRYVFDYSALKRFGIDEKLLPKGSIVLNKPFSFYERYHSLVWTIGSIILLLISTIILLIFVLVIRHRTRIQIANEKERLAVTICNITDGVLATDENGVIIVINPVAEALLGCKNKSCLQHQFGEKVKLLRCESSNCVLDILFENIKQLKAFDIIAPIEVSHSDGEAKYITIAGSPILGAENHKMGMVIVIRDVSEKLKIEQALQNTAKLESLGVMAGGIAHDFNNLLGGLFGYVDLSRMYIHENKYADADESLSKLSSVFERARTLTQQLLTFAKGGQPVKKVTAMQDLITDAVRFVLAGSTVAPIFSFNKNLWLCEVDPNQIGQVLDNLTINALHAMPKGGRLMISADNVDFREQLHPSLMPGLYVKIEVCDNGIGIDPKNINKIFDPFFTTKQKGTGLGLATSFSIIKKHHGHIEVKSELEKGATFTIYLPAMPDGHLVLDRAPDQDRISFGGRILIVDDETFILDITQNNLENAGYTVMAAHTDVEASSMFKQALNYNEKFDVLILDLTMPGGKGGVQLANEFYELDPNVKIIASSGYSDDPVLASPQEFHFSGILKKPYTQNELIQTVRKVMDS